MAGGAAPGSTTASAPDPPRLRLDDVRVRFDGHDALDGVDLEVADGEVVALLGPSGCGKTTLLRVVAGLQPPTSGRVLLDGTDVAPMPPHRRGVGLMFQEYALFPHRDVGANVAFGLAMRREPRAAVRRRVGEVLELVGLSGYERRPVAELSGGEQQRVALARALAPSPRILMLDEPLGALDRTLRDRLVVDLQRIFAQLAVTVVYVTHDQGEALALADRVVVMERGAIAQVGTPAAVWARPASASVARLLGLAVVVDVVVAGGHATAPWGPLGPVPGLPDGPGQVVVRPDAVALVADPGAGLRATVVGRTFRGERTIVRLEVGEAGLTIDAAVEPGSAPPDGAVVGAVVDPAGVVPLGPPAP
jgi:thiamine transport system ATP-binding protein